MGTKRKKSPFKIMIFILLVILCTTSAVLILRSSKQATININKLEACSKILTFFDLDTTRSKEYGSHFVELDEIFRIEGLWEIAVVLAVTENEAFDPNFHKPGDGIGLLQVCESTGKSVVKAHPELKINWEDGKTLYDPRSNIIIGVRYFLDAYVYTGNLNNAIKGYNAGYENKKLNNDLYLTRFKNKQTLFTDYKLKIEIPR